MNADVLEKPDLDTKADNGDHDKFAHYVPKDSILEAAVSGKPARALCGKNWFPDSNPDRFPVCPDCKAIYEDDAEILKR